MLEQLMGKPTTFVTAVWIFHVVSLNIGAPKQDATKGTLAAGV